MEQENDANRNFAHFHLHTHTQQSFWCRFWRKQGNGGKYTCETCCPDKPLTTLTAPLTCRNYLYQRELNITSCTYYICLCWYCSFKLLRVPLELFSQTLLFYLTVKAAQGSTGRHCDRTLRIEMGKCVDFLPTALTGKSVFIMTAVENQGSLQQ